MRSVLIISAFAFALSGCVSVQVSDVVGEFYAPQPCSQGIERELLLRSDGSYCLTSILPEGVGPDVGEGARAGYEEEGRWMIRGDVVTLTAETGAKITLRVSVVDGATVLWDGEMFGMKFRKERQPNQALQTTSVTRNGFGRVSVLDRHRRGV